MITTETFYFIKLKEEGGMVCLLSNRKKRVSRNWTRGINFFLIEGKQPNFYAENIPFCLQQSSPAVLHPILSLVVHHRDSKCLSLTDAFRQDLNNQTKMPHQGQLYIVIIYMRASM